MKHFFVLGLAAAAVLSAAVVHAGEKSAPKLELQITPTVSIAPASVLVRVIVEHDQNNRQLEIVADSSDFYRRSVMSLDGENAPKVNEIRLIAIPGGEYDVTATLTDSRGAQSRVHKSIMVLAHGVE